MAKDWICGGCKKVNWARRYKCFLCNNPKTDEQMNDDWKCNKCNDYQFARNVRCRTCHSHKKHNDRHADVMVVPPGDECIVCIAEKRDCIVVHGETGHRVMCMTCSTRVVKCPICRMTITSRIKVFD